MGITYTTYEAKAKFSEVMRQCSGRQDCHKSVSYRGEPVAEIRPLEKRRLTQEEMGPGDGAARSSSPSQESKRTNQSWEVCAGSFGSRFLAERD